MTTILAPATQATNDLRARLNRLTRATAACHPGAHRMLTHTLNTLGVIADQTPGLDLGDWNNVHSYAMTCVERIDAARAAGQPTEEHGHALQHYLTVLAGIIGRAVSGDDAPEQPASTADQVVDMLAELAADRQMEPGAHLLATALRGALRLARPGMPLDEVRDEADHLMQQARRDQQAAEYGQTATAVTR